jgi:hypothetical protein
MHAMQPSKFYLNELSWQILEIQNLWCYKPTIVKRNLAFEIQVCLETTPSNLLCALLHASK